MAEDIAADSEQEQSAESERPEWLPEKFESPEALSESYAQLERRLTEVGEERNNQDRQLEDLYGRLQSLEAERSQPQQQAYNPQHDPYLMAYQNAMENGDYQAALGIQMGLVNAAVQGAQQPQQQAPPKDYEAWAYVAEQTAVNQVGGQEEWAQYKDRVSREAENENFEGLSAQQAGQKLARIYKMVKADDVLSNQQTLVEQRASADREAKIAAQTQSGSSGRPPEPSRDEQAIEAIKKAAKQGSYDSFIGGS